MPGCHSSCLARRRWIPLPVSGPRDRNLSLWARNPARADGYDKNSFVPRVSRNLGPDIAQSCMAHLASYVALNRVARFQPLHCLKWCGSLASQHFPNCVAHFGPYIALKRVAHLRVAHLSPFIARNRIAYLVPSLPLIQWFVWMPTLP